MAKKNDFVQINYTGSVEGKIFDTTQESVAKSEGIHNPQKKYGPVIVCVGKRHVVAGLDEALESNDGRFSVTVGPEKAFGKREGKLIQLVPTAKLTQNKIRPYPGLQLNIDGTVATVKSVSGGRCMVDFNHPLAGKDVTYDVEILGVVEDDKKKLEAMLARDLQMAPNIEEKDGKLVVKGLPDAIHAPLQKHLEGLLKSEVVFEGTVSAKPEAKKPEEKPAKTEE